MTARTGMADLLTRLRDLGADRVKLYRDTMTGDGAEKVFHLRASPQAAGGTITVGTAVQGTANYTWDTTYGRIAFGTAPGSGTAIAVEYMTSQYTDDELEDVLDSHVLHVEDTAIRWLPDTIGGGTLNYTRAALGYRDLEGTVSGTTRWTLKDSVGSAITGYTLDAVQGQLAFTGDQGGTIYYWTGKSYDLWSAAADVWERKAASLADWYSFASGGERFERQQAFDHAGKMAKSCRSRAGQNRSRGGLQTGVFVRGDLNARSG